MRLSAGADGAPLRGGVRPRRRPRPRRPARRPAPASLPARVRPRPARGRRVRVQRRTGRPGRLGVVRGPAPQPERHAGPRSGWRSTSTSSTPAAHSSPARTSSSRSCPARRRRSAATPRAPVRRRRWRSSRPRTPSRSSRGPQPTARSQTSDVETVSAGGQTTTTGSLASTFPTEQSFVQLVAIYRDGAGAIVGGASGARRVGPAGGLRRRSRSSRRRRRRRSPRPRSTGRRRGEARAAGGGPDGARRSWSWPRAARR